MMSEETNADFDPSGEDEADYGDGEMEFGSGETGDDPDTSAPGLGTIYEHGDDDVLGGDAGGHSHGPGMDTGQESMDDPSGE